MRSRFKVLTVAAALASLAVWGCIPIQSKGIVHRLGSTDPCGSDASLGLPLKAGSSKLDPEVTRAGVLAIGNTMVYSLCLELKAKHESHLASTITERARLEMATAVGRLVIANDEASARLRSRKSSPRKLTEASLNAPEIVTGPIVRGAFLSLVDPNAALDAVTKRVDMAQDIISGTSLALRDQTSSLSSEQALDVLSSMANAAVKTLPEANLGGDNSKDAVAAVTSTAVGALPKAGYEIANLGQAAQKLAEGAVAALNTPGFEVSTRNSLTGEVAGSAIQGLTKAGLSAEKIIETGAIESIISGAAEGLKRNESSGESAVEAIGSIAGAAVSVLSKVGLSTPDLQKGALAAVVKSSMNGAQSLSGSTNSSIADTMSAVASQAVLALSNGGFAANQIGEAISVIVESGVSEIAESGNGSASDATAIASKLIEGALAGAGNLIQSGLISSDQASEVAQAASTGAVEGLQSLQTAGIVTGDAVSIFTSSIVDSVSSGLEKAGADAQVIANAQSGATSIVESEAVQEQIQANTGAAQAVAMPTISAASGLYTAVFLVTISSSTDGASIRYTLDGSAPTARNGTIYSGAIPITGSKTLKAFAYKAGWSNSEVVSADYELKIPIFGSPNSFVTGVNPEGVTAADLNGDGKIDLAVALYVGKGVSFLLGNGNGSFSTKQDVSSSPNSAGTFNTIQSALITTGDLNGDYKPDVVWGAWGHNFVSLLTNTTSPNASMLSFANNIPSAFNAGISGPRTIVLTDIDANGQKDIVIGESNGNKLKVYLNQSGNPGAFTLSTSNWLFNPDNSVYTGNAHPWMIASADFNKDNKPDIVGGGGFGGIFSVLLNSTITLGTPSFQIASRMNTNSALGCSNNSTLSISDFNGDGSADVVASCPSTGPDKVAVFLNTTSAFSTVASFSTSSLASTKGIKAVTSGDVNADGKTDIVSIVGGSTDTLNVYLGNGDGTFGNSESFMIGSATGPSKVILADLNADSRLDAIITNGSTNKVTVFLNQTL